MKQIFMAQFFNLIKEDGEIEKVVYGISTIVTIAEIEHNSLGKTTEICLAGENTSLLVVEVLDEVLSLLNNNAFLVQLTEKPYKPEVSFG